MCGYALFLVTWLLRNCSAVLNFCRKRDQEESRKAQTERFAFENVEYNNTGDMTANGGVPVANGETRVANKGIGSIQNGNVPYSSPLDRAKGAEWKHGAIFNNVSSLPQQEPQETIHVYDHHENRPVEWPPKPPTGVRLSFRKHKNTDQDPPYEELPTAQRSGESTTDADFEDYNANNNAIDESALTISSGKSTGQDIAAAGQPPPPPPLPTSTRPRPRVNFSFPALDPRNSVSLKSGLNDEEMTNITQSTT